MNFKELWTTFDGRISRKPFWAGILLLIGILFIVWWILFGVIVGMFGWGARVELYVRIAFTLLYAYPATALMVQRLHDRNRPGILAAVIWTPTVVGLLGELLGVMNRIEVIDGEALPVPTTIGWVVLGVSLVIGIWALIELGILRGTKGPNQYGPDPLE